MNVFSVHIHKFGDKNHIIAFWSMVDCTQNNTNGNVAGIVI